MKNKYKLTPDIHKDLINVAKTMPASQRVDRNKKPMFRIVTQLKSSVLEGEKIKNSFTNIKEPIMVNHEVNLREVYQKDGPAGVREYVEFFMSLKKEENENHITTPVEGESAEGA